MAPGPCFMHRPTAALFEVSPASVARSPYFWWTALMHWPRFHWADHATLGANSEPSKQETTKILAVITFSSCRPDGSIGLPVLIVAAAKSSLIKFAEAGADRKDA